MCVIHENEKYSFYSPLKMWLYCQKCLLFDLISNSEKQSIKPIANCVGLIW